jgi:predicted CXXCH cytochrome family protein
MPIGLRPELLNHRAGEPPTVFASVPFAVRHTQYALVVSLLLIFFPSIARGQTTKAGGAELCYTCHQELKAKFSQGTVHAPVKMGLCDSCHNPHTARFPKLLARKGAELCYACHQDKKAAWSEGSVHAPVQDGNCLACHDPHASPNKFALKMAAGELCMSCHQKLSSAAKQVKHMPFETGDCLQCHTAHASKQKGLLVKASSDLCRGCHNVADVKVRRAHNPFSIEKAACESCHAPHGSNHKGLIKTVAHPPFGQGRCGACHQVNSSDPVKTFLQGQELCYTCHAKQAQDFRKKLVHKPVAGGQCLGCHTPHASEDKGLLGGRERVVCLNCHTQTQEKFKVSKAFHPASVADGKCSICHAPHASDQRWLFSKDSLQTCSTCHQSHAALSHPMGPGVVDPRDKQPLTCLSCHDPHGTQLATFITFPKERELCIQCHRGELLRTRQ